MRFDSQKAQRIELTREIAFPGDIRFDPDKVTLLGRYGDQLSAYRAKKVWVETLESCFLLENDHDFSVHVESNLAHCEFGISCTFTSACGRYAFWRLTNEQAPEAQYLLETAHIPNSEMTGDSFIAAPDLKPTVETALESAEWKAREAENFVSKLVAKLKDIVSPK